VTQPGSAPLVTVGMAVFNGERWIGDAIESILNQSFTDFELLISDNCSTDQTYSICQRYASRDVRVRLVRTNFNVGAAENFNRMCRMTGTKYFKYASCNDICAPNLLLRCVEILEQHEDVVVCHSRVRLLSEDGTEPRDYEHGMHLMSDSPFERFKTYLETVRLNNVEQGLIRTNELRKTSLQEPFVASDINFMAELALLGKFYEVPEYLFYRRQARGAMSASRTKEELASLYSPGQRKLLWQSWRQLSAYLRMTLRVPLRARERSRLLSYIGRMWRLSRRQLLADVYEAGSYAVFSRFYARRT
jgi:glycosyltransferase involved in cell wall biosynthesis